MKKKNIWTVLAALGLMVAGAVAQAGERKLYLDEFRDRMEGAWLGQSVGVAYGCPTEFRHTGTIIPEAEVPAWTPDRVNNTFDQDDLYVEMTFLATLEKRGIGVTCREAGIDFANSTYRVWCANANGRDRIRRGIAAPSSSHPKNHPSPDDIDYQIESDFSGIVAPGMPQRAVKLGEQFGRIMNYGDGLYAGQFVGGMYAEAYFESDRVKTVEAGLKCIPAESKYAQMVRDMLAWYRADPKNWQVAWTNAVAKYGRKDGPMLGKVSFPGIDVKINGAMVLLGYLWGDGDILKTMSVSTRGGYDSDCNPSSALGILGTQLGAKRFGPEYTKGLDRTKKWSYTDYDWPGLLKVSEKLVRQFVIAEGGKVGKDAKGEYFLIPVKDVAVAPAVDSLKPGPGGDEKLTEAENAAVLYRPCKGQGDRSEFKDTRPTRMDRAKLQIGTYYLHPVAQDEAHVKAMKECGIDFVFGVDAGRRAALDLLAKYGIGCVATGVFPGWGGGDGRYAGQLEKKHPLDEYAKAAQAFRDHPAIWMVDIGDEPSALEFPYYARILPEIRKYLPKEVLPYLNLYPNYAQVTKNTDSQQTSQLGTATYGEHVDRYAAAIPLDYLSYDFYVYSAPSGGFDAFLAKMYDNFETVAASCRRTGRSFWYIPQVNNVYPTYHMSPNRLRFQAFTALAYGAEVINWACWMKGWWEHNVVNPDGTVNEYEYLILKTVNRELHTIGPDYMRYRNVATHRLGFGAAAKKALDLPAFKGLSVAEGGRLVVGEMTARAGKGTAFLAVASDDPRDAGARQKTLVFRPTGAFRVLRPTGPCDAKPGADGLVRLPIAAAEAIFVMDTRQVLK